MLLGLVLCPLKQRTITARHGLGRAVKTLSNASHIHPKRTNAGIKKFLEWIPIVSSFYNFPIPAPLFIHMVHMKANMIFQWVTKNWCFWIVMLEKTLDSKEIQPVHPVISPGCSLEGLMLKLKLQYFGHLMQRIDSLEKTLMLGVIGGRRRRGR